MAWWLIVLICVGIFSVGCGVGMIIMVTAADEADDLSVGCGIGCVAVPIFVALLWLAIIGIKALIGG